MLPPLLLLLLLVDSCCLRQASCLLVRLQGAHPAMPTQWWVIIEVAPGLKVQQGSKASTACCSPGA
jgi:hypothetical protein